jgi:hypothetical protein
MFRNTGDIRIDLNDGIYEDLHFNFEDKSLNKEVEDHIFNHMRNYPISKTIKIILHMPKNMGQANEESIVQEFHRHFKYKQLNMALFIKQQLREWWVNMFIGVLFLILCLLAVEICDAFIQMKGVKIIKETLYIICSVALWEPITFILFGLRIERKARKYYEKLSCIPIIIKRDGKNIAK